MRDFRDLAICCVVACILGLLVGLMGIGGITVYERLSCPESKLKIEEFGQFCTILDIKRFNNYYDKVLIVDSMGTKREMIYVDVNELEKSVPGDYWLLGELDGKVRLVKRIPSVMQQESRKKTINKIAGVWK